MAPVRGAKRRSLAERSTVSAIPEVVGRSARDLQWEPIVAPACLARVRRVKIAVCVKQVPDATSHRRLDPATHRLDRSGEGVLNATDVNAVEEALRLKDAHGGEVVVVSVGPEKAMESLRKALAMGADRALLVTDEAAAGSDLLATSRALAAALAREEAALVLFGQQSSDADGAVLWAAVSDRLRRPMVSQVAELTVDGGELTGKRQTEFGYDVIGAPLPAVVAVSDAINEPRYPSLKGIMGAKSKPQETVSLADLGVDASLVGETGSGTTVRSSAPPPPKSGQVRIEDDGSAADKIFEYLAEKRLV
jgi:electron transfer flavoprotein beta subunit